MRAIIEYIDRKHVDVVCPDGHFLYPADDFNRRHEGVWNSRVLAFVPQQWKHVLHTCNREGCFICNGVLAQCIVCGGAEATLPTECPGVQMTQEQQDAVQLNQNDYINGSWTVFVPQQQTEGWICGCRQTNCGGCDMETTSDFAHFSDGTPVASYEQFN